MKVTENISKNPIPTEFLNKIGHFLFFGAFFFLNNPFFSVETSLRFIIYVVMIFLGGLTIFYTNNIKVKPKLSLILFLAFIFIVSILRLNVVESLEDVSTNEQIFQLTISFFVIITSILIFDSFKISSMRSAMLLSSLLCIIPICINYQDLFDYSQKNSFLLGNLSYDSYQTVSQILGMFVILGISQIYEKKKFDLKSIILFNLIMLSIFVILQGYARGESIALFISLSLYFLGGFLSVVLFISALLFGNIILSYVDTPLIQRISSILQGDYGERDVLFGQATSAIISDPIIFLFGGGINYFQYYYNYYFELYPHNIFLEATLSGGVFFGLVMIWIYIRPIIIFVLSPNNQLEKKFLFAFSVYNILIYFKSGTIVSFWGLGFLTCVYLLLADSCYARDSKYQPS